MQQQTPGAIRNQTASRLRNVLEAGAMECSGCNNEPEGSKVQPCTGEHSNGSHPTCCTGRKDSIDLIQKWRNRPFAKKTYVLNSELSVVWDNTNKNPLGWWGVRGGGGRRKRAVAIPTLPFGILRRMVSVRVWPPFEAHHAPTSLCKGPVNCSPSNCRNSCTCSRCRCER